MNILYVRDGNIDPVTIFNTDLAGKILLPDSIKDPSSEVNMQPFPPKEELKGMRWETFTKKSAEVLPIM